MLRLLVARVNSARPKVKKKYPSNYRCYISKVFAIFSLPPDRTHRDLHKERQRKIKRERKMRTTKRDIER